MAKRLRDFKRISMTAKTAEWIFANLCEKTFKDHVAKCDDRRAEPCYHEESLSLDVARFLADNMKIGKKRATVDFPCPYSTNDAKRQATLYDCVILRLISFSAVQGKTQVRVACERICDELQAYRNRNAMQVIAESAR